MHLKYGLNNSFQYMHILWFKVFSSNITLFFCTEYIREWKSGSAGVTYHKTRATFQCKWCSLSDNWGVFTTDHILSKRIAKSVLYISCEPFLLQFSHYSNSWGIGSSVRLMRFWSDWRVFHWLRRFRTPNKSRIDVTQLYFTILYMNLRHKKNKSTAFGCEYWLPLYI